MIWFRQSVAVGVLWAVFTAVTIAVCTVGSAALSLAGALPEGSLAHGFNFATSNVEYVACGALCVATTLVYSGLVRPRPHDAQPA